MYMVIRVPLVPQSVSSLDRAIIGMEKAVHSTSRGSTHAISVICQIYIIIKSG